MKAILISDKEYQTETYQSLKDLIGTFLKNKGFATEMMEVGTDNLKFCMGCFGCWVKKPGECIINDMMAQINRNVMNSDVVIYLNPVFFGHFSPNIKNAIDRSLPNMLPFFKKGRMVQRCIRLGMMHIHSRLSSATEIRFLMKINSFLLIFQKNISKILKF